MLKKVPYLLTFLFSLNSSALICYDRVVDQTEAYTHDATHFKKLLLIEAFISVYVLYAAYSTCSCLAKFFSMRKLDNIKEYGQQSVLVAPIGSACKAKFQSLEEYQFQEMIDELMFNNVGYNEAEIKLMLIRSYNLYQFPNFVACLRKWPEYWSNTQAILDEAKQNAELKKFLDQIPGFTRGKFVKFLRDES